MSDFETAAGGRRLASSIGGVLTGRGADIIVLDDPQKADEALSETSRKAVNTWYDNTLLSRLNNKAEGAIVIVMQRLHQDDLVGHVLEQEDWEVLTLPAIAVTDERHLIEGPLGKRYFVRKPGDILHPERESESSLRTTRAAIGEFSFSTQYQQNPIPLGGAMIRAEWLRYFEPGNEPAKFTSIIQRWDTANKSGELNDYSVCTVWGFLKEHFYLLEVVRKRLNYPELRREAVRLTKKYNPNIILIEDKASGMQLIQDLKADGLRTVKPYEPQPNTDKTMRLHAQTAIFENGFVHLPKSAPWLGEYISEIMSFPGARYDDQVDSTAQALDFMHSKARRQMIITDRMLELASRRPPGHRSIFF